MTHQSDEQSGTVVEGGQAIARTATEPIERILWRGQPIAYIVRREYYPEQTEFLTPDDFKQQVGFVVYPAGGTIAPHLHRPLKRSLIGTSEALLVRQGRVEVDLYSDDRRFIGTWTLEEGDLILLISGGHGFRMLEDTVLLEIKQGPYTGLDEKERF